MNRLNMVLILLCIGCAQQSILTGGKKDTTAPTIIHNTDSLSNKYNFDKKEFTLKFNENIQYLKSKSSLLVNPYISNKEVVVNKNMLFVKWDKDLDTNTTYSFIFNNSIADITEKNKIKNLQYAFSTGSKFDSGSVKGKIIITPSEIPAKNMLIELKNCNNQNIIYYGYTDENGEFIVNNVKIGTYMLTYFNDNNNDFKLDTLNDVQGFYSNNITVNDSSNLSQIVAFEPSKKIRLEKSSIDSYNKVELEFNQLTESCVVFDTINKNTYISNIKNKNHEFYLEDTLDKFLIIINSKKPNFCDTIRLTNLEKNNDKTLSFKEKQNKSLINNLFFSISFNQFINLIDTSKIQLFKDSIGVSYEIEYQSNELIIKPLSGPGNYKLILLPESVTGLITQKSDTSNIYFKINPKEELASLELKISNVNHSNSIIQITRANEIKNEFSFEGSSLDTIIENCIPGNYKLKLIEDSNEDGCWTTGDIKRKIQPENIFHYEEEIVLKKNWISSNTWVINNPE